MSATPLSDTECARSLEVVEKALGRYPVPLLQENLEAVFLVETLHFSGVTASGTYGSDRVYIANGGAKKGFTNAWMTGVFHAEFSSVLLWRHKNLLDTVAWNACNPSDFRYGNKGVGAIKEGTASTKTSPLWWQKGFLSQYATASVEEDFNSVVAYLFANAPGTRPALDASPALKQKAALVESFYDKLGMDINAIEAPVAPKSIKIESSKFRRNSRQGVRLLRYVQ